MNKKLISLCLIVLLLLGWYTAAKSYFGLEGKYKQAVAAAKELEKREIYIRAIDGYEEALTYKPNDKAAMYAIARDYKALEEYDSYVSRLDAIIKTVGPDEDIVRELYQYYLDENRLQDAGDLAYALYRKYPDNSLAAQLYDERRGDYTIQMKSYEYLSVFRDEIAMYEIGGQKGLVSSDGEVYLDAKYQDVSYPQENGYIPVVENGKAKYVNKKGYKLDDPYGETYEYLTGVSAGSILAKKNGKYGYLDESYIEKTEFIWDDATKIMNGIGAVKQGGKWALINEEFSLITEYIYDDVVMDDFRRCSLNGVCWVKKGEKYQLVDAAGAVISQKSYDNVKAFVSDGPCAVEDDGKWGYVDAAGTEVIEPSYQGADSYSGGMAPVEKNGLWGMMDEKQTIFMEPAFQEMKPVNNKGYSPVKLNESWGIIRLRIFENN